MRAMTQVYASEGVVVTGQKDPYTAARYNSWLCGCFTLENDIIFNPYATRFGQQPSAKYPSTRSGTQVSASEGVVFRQTQDPVSAAKDDSLLCGKALHERENIGTYVVPTQVWYLSLSYNQLQSIPVLGQAHRCLQVTEL